MSTSFRRTLRLALGGVFVGVVAGSDFGDAPPERDGPASISGALDALVVSVQEVARGCGVYGLAGSPAVIALSAGADARVAGAEIESEIFGGEDAERCVLEGVADVPMNRDGVRVVLPVLALEDSDGARLRPRLFQPGSLAGVWRYGAAPRRGIVARMGIVLWLAKPVLYVVMFWVAAVVFRAQLPERPRAFVRGLGGGVVRLVAGAMLGFVFAASAGWGDQQTTLLSLFFLCGLLAWTAVAAVAFRGVGFGRVAAFAVVGELIGGAIDYWALQEVSSIRFC